MKKNLAVVTTVFTVMSYIANIDGTLSFLSKFNFSQQTITTISRIAGYIFPLLIMGVISYLTWQYFETKKILETQDETIKRLIASLGALDKLVVKNDIDIRKDINLRLDNLYEQIYNQKIPVDITLSLLLNFLTLDVDDIHRYEITRRDIFNKDFKNILIHMPLPNKDNRFKKDLQETFFSRVQELINLKNDIDKNI